MDRSLVRLPDGHAREPSVPAGPLVTSYKTTLTLEGSDGSKLQLQAYAHKSPDSPCRATQCLAAPCQALPRPYLFSFRLPRAASRTISAMKDLEVNAPHRGRVKGSPRQATFVRLRARRGFPSIMKTVAILAVNAGVLQRGIVATVLEHDKPASHAHQEECPI